MSIKLWQVAALSVSLASFGGAANAETIELTMSSWVPPTHWIYTEGFLPWTEQIEEVTEGRVKVNVLPKPIGPPAEHFDFARKGLVDITYGTYTYQPERFKIFEFLEFPLGNADAARTSVAAWDAFQRHLSGDETHVDVQLLSLFMMGTGAVHHSEKVMGSAEDFAGQKFRMGGPVQKGIIDGLGATPVAASVTKSYELLSSKVIDGSLNPYSDVVGFRIDEQLPYHTEIPGGFYDASIFLVVNKASFERISPEDQSAIMKISGAELAHRMGTEFTARNKRARDLMIEQGARVELADEALTSAVREIRAQLVADWVSYAKDRGYDHAEDILSEYWAAIGAEPLE